MFEFDQYESGREGVRTKPTMPYRPFDNFARRALLQWGEHCIECAAPDCFSSCDLYDRRPDRRCRRFAYGIYLNDDYPSAAGFGAEVVFRRWGKIEARANAKLFDRKTTAAIEMLLTRISAAINLIGVAMNAVTRDVRWAYVGFGLRERLNRLLHRLAKPQLLPDAFIVEVYNPSNETVRLSMTISVNRAEVHRPLRADQLPRPCTRALDFVPGYNFAAIPVDEFVDILSSRLPFSIALTPLSGDGTHLVFLCLELIQYATNAGGGKSHEGISRTGRQPAKCVVFDLDNTLWHGILVEGDVKLRRGVADLFRGLDERGILISVASKNSEEDAMAQLRKYGLDEYVLYPQINWGPKSHSLQMIAKSLDIGIDTFVFVDDSPFEREEVLRVHPEVETLSETSLATLLSHPRLMGAATQEARARRSMYVQAQRREAEAGKFDGNYMAFLESCDIHLRVFSIDESVLDRAVELVQRTNQLNFSGRKYGRSEFEAILVDPLFRTIALSCRDKYGDYGVIGVCIWSQSGDAVHVHDLMISCRVQGKFIEQALFGYLARSCSNRVGRIEVKFTRTKRNELAEAVLRKIGFVDGEKGCVVLDLSGGDLAADFITVSA